MTGAEGALVFMGGIVLIVSIVVLLDWWARRKTGRRAIAPRANLSADFSSVARRA